ncbi:MAG: hypothetical protein ACLU1W_04300 [Collinsella sp.]
MSLDTLTINGKTYEVTPEQAPLIEKMFQEFRDGMLPEPDYLQTPSAVLPTQMGKGCES